MLLCCYTSVIFYICYVCVTENATFCIIVCLLLQKMPIPSVIHYRLLDYSFSDFELSDDDTIKASIRMFLEMDLLNKFHIDYEVS